MKRFIITLFSVIMVILQVYLSPVISIAGYAPDFVLILLAVLGAKESLAALLLTGVAAGAVIDLTTAGGTFINTAVYFIAALICALHRYVQIKGAGFVNTAAYTLVSSAAKYFILMFALYIVKIETSLSLLIFFANIPAMLYSALASIPFYYLYYLICKLRFMREEKEDGVIISNSFFK